MERSIVLAIGGWDPSGGAGLAADIKTLEMNGVVGMGIATAITFQSADRFWGLRWIELKDIVNQFNSIVSQYDIACVKIGMIQDPSIVRELVGRLSALNVRVPIVWDPVLKASAGYEFVSQTKGILNLMDRIALLTPNQMEFQSIFGEVDAINHVNELIKQNGWGAVLLKGGHAEDHASDVLLNGQSCLTIEGQRFDNLGKHGSGCVLSSAIAGGLAKGLSLAQACTEGKRYVERFLLSSSSLLGRHSIEVVS